VPVPASEAEPGSPEEAAAAATEEEEAAEEAAAEEAAEEAAAAAAAEEAADGEATGAPGAPEPGSPEEAAALEAARGGLSVEAYVWRQLCVSVAGMLSSDCGSDRHRFLPPVSTEPVRGWREDGAAWIKMVEELQNPTTCSGGSSAGGSGGSSVVGSAGGSTGEDCTAGTHCWYLLTTLNHGHCFNLFTLVSELMHTWTLGRRALVANGRYTSNISHYTHPLYIPYACTVVTAGTRLTLYAPLYIPTVLLHCWYYRYRWSGGGGCGRGWSCFLGPLSRTSNCTVDNVPSKDLVVCVGPKCATATKACMGGEYNAQYGQCECNSSSLPALDVLEGCMHLDQWKRKYFHNQVRRLRMYKLITIHLLRRLRMYKLIHAQ
jgi:hypothetical protein